jgi:ACS family tartrate transporter-like MFS transporter
MKSTPWRGTTSGPEAAATTTPRRVAFRLLPFLAVLYVVAYIDRANVAFAATAMRSDLGFSQELFGFGSGIFFAGYLLLGLPGAVITARFGARRWIVCILLTWGSITVLGGLAHTAVQFICVRFLLGLAEGGFLPAIVCYLSRWFRQRDRARALAGFIVAQPVAMSLSSGISSALLRVHWLHMAGWRWLFFLEGLPALGCGVWTWFYMTDTPDQAEWLSVESREWLIGELAAETAGHAQQSALPWWAGLKQPRVLLLTATTFFACLAGYGFTLWLPSMLEGGSHAGSAAGATGALRSLLPFGCGIVGTLVIGWRSDKSSQPARYACGALFAAGVFLLLAAIAPSAGGLALMCFCCTGAMVWAWTAPFWVLLTLLLREEAAAAAIGFVNSVGNLGGFAGAYLIGRLLTHGWTYSGATVWLSVSYVLAAGCTYLAVRLGRRARAPASGAMAEA